MRAQKCSKKANCFLGVCLYIQAGLEHHSLHSLRHTNITLQLLAGVPLVTVSARAGHSKVSTTSDIYSHVVQSSDRQAAEMLDELLKSKLKKD